MTQVIGVMGKVSCPGEPRREIRINKEDTNRLPLDRFPVCSRKRNCKGTQIKVIADKQEYRTCLHRYEDGSYIADAIREMKYSLKDVLDKCRLGDSCNDVHLKVQGYEFMIVPPSGWHP